MEEKSTLSVPIDEVQDHILGDPKAPITLVEYGDYECPHCARAHFVVKEIEKALGKKICFVFRNFPLTQIHSNAEIAAEAAEAAGTQGRFWEMHDALFENQDDLSPDLLLTLAEDLDIDVPRLAEELEERKFEPKVRQDFMGGVKSGVNGTPTFFINGVRYDGPWEPAESFIEALMAL